MFANAQFEKACRVLEGLRAPLEMRLDPGPDPEDKLSRALSDVATQIVRAAGDRLKLITMAGLGDGLPVLQVENVRYRAVPFGPELDPFLEILLLLSGRAAKGRDTDTLAPASLQVLMAPTCPNCPRMVSICGRLAADHPGLDLEVVDVQYLRHLAGNISSVPTTIIDGTRTVVGVISPSEILQILEGRSSQEYARQALASMLESGRVADVASLLTTAQGHRALGDLLQRSSMQQRIGIMVAVEEALAQDRHALDGAVPLLLPLLGSEDDALRGDTVDLLGRIGAPGAREALSSLLTDANPDVREAVADALQSLRQPS